MIALDAPFHEALKETFLMHFCFDSVLSALRGTAVPVPTPLALCQDESVLGTPFYVMTYVNGRIFKDPTLPGMKVCNESLDSIINPTCISNLYEDSCEFSMSQL